MRTITPTFFGATSWSQITPTYALMALWPLQFLLCSSLLTRHGTITIMPDFTPNPYMLEKFADKGKEPWEIYAWCVRDAIAKHAGLKILDVKLGLQDKKAYVALMNHWKNKVEVNGEVYEYRGNSIMINPSPMPSKKED